MLHYRPRQWKLIGQSACCDVLITVSHIPKKAILIASFQSLFYSKSGIVAAPAINTKNMSRRLKLSFQQILDQILARLQSRRQIAHNPAAGPGSLRLTPPDHRVGVGAERLDGIR
jgi:hypothetical protein